MMNTDSFDALKTCIPYTRICLQMHVSDVTLINTDVHGYNTRFDHESKST